MQYSECVTILKQRNSGHSCNYPNCKTRFYMNGKIKCMHKFPRSENVSRLWKKNCNIEESRNCSTYRICRDHFKDEDYAYPESRRLKLNAVPVPFNTTAHNDPIDKKPPEMNEALTPVQKNEEIFINQHIFKSYSFWYNVQNHFRNSGHLFACINGAPEQYKCDICEFTSDFKVNLIDHAIQVHNLPKTKHNMALIMKKLECQNCKLETYSFLLFKLHRCKSTYKTPVPSSMKQHTSSKHTEPEEIKSFKCELCEDIFKQKVALKKHVWTQHIIGESSRKSNTKRVIEETSKKTNIRRLKCELCKSKFNQKAQLKAHVLNSHIMGEWSGGTKRKSVLLDCEHCPFQTKSKVAMKRHLLNWHTNYQDVSWFECKYCKFRCRVEENLSKHMSWKHPKEADPTLQRSSPLILDERK